MFKVFLFFCFFCLLGVCVCMFFVVVISVPIVKQIY